jgi:two-component system alkaline phosphatase synthesis response regulator PhoP
MLRVLVADDVPAIIGVLRVLLELWGHEVRTAQDGLEAVKVAAEFKPDVALLDIMMPKMDGVSAARLIRQQVPGCKVYALSATKVEHPDGFDVFLLKPYDPEHLRRLLEEQGCARGATDAATAGPDC